MTATPAPVSATRSRILVIEDEPSVAAFLRTALERHGYEVTSSSSAVEGLHLLALARFPRRDFRFPHSRRNHRRRCARLAAASPARNGHANYFHHRRYRQRRNHRAAGARWHSLRRKTVPRSAIHGRGGKDDWQTMKDELRLRFLIVDDEQSIRRLCMTVGQGLGYRLRRSRDRRSRARIPRNHRRLISSSPI